LFDFHGAFKEKKDAERKERATPGAFIKTVWFASGPRYAVLTGDKKAANPAAIKKYLKNNPSDAADMYTKFHGRGPSGHKDLIIPEIDPYGSHPEIAHLGHLVLLIVGEGIGEIKPTGSSSRNAYEIFRQNDDDPDAWAVMLEKWTKKSAPSVAASPDGHHLYFAGGDQDLEEYLDKMGAHPSKDVCDLGFCYMVVYDTQKKFDGYESTDYYHKLGEESDVPPRLIYYRKEKLFALVGGEYTVKDVGIVN